MKAPLQLTPKRLEHSAWEPYGWLPVDDTDPRDGQRRLTFTLGDPHVNVIKHDIAEVERTEGYVVCAEVFRHHTHTQTLMVLDHDAVMAVAAPGTAFDTDAHLDAIEAFALKPGDAFVLHQDTWHWGPYPIDAAVVHMFNVQGFGWAQDNERQPLDLWGAPPRISLR